MHNKKTSDGFAKRLAFFYFRKGPLSIKLIFSYFNAILMPILPNYLSIKSLIIKDLITILKPVFIE
jgi:hypothetical protein